MLSGRADVMARVWAGGALVVATLTVSSWGPIHTQSETNGAQNRSIASLDRTAKKTLEVDDIQTRAIARLQGAAAPGSCLYNDATCAEFDRLTRQLNGSCLGRGYTITIDIGATTQRVSGACKAQP